MKIYDPTGTAAELIRDRYPQARVDTISTDGDCDAAVICSGLDRSPESLIADAARAVKEGGRVIVTAPEQADGGVQALRSIDLCQLLRRHGRLLQFGVDGDGLVRGVMTPSRRRGEVAVWTGYAIGPWHPTDIVERGLGGSETAAYRLAEELARIGYTVTLYGHFDEEGALGDVLLRHFQRFDPTRPLTAFIGFRDATRFDHPVNAQAKILWLEDLPGQERLSPERMRNIDRVCCVSRWHRQATLDTYPWLSSTVVEACRNGVTHEFFDGPQPEREQRVVYTSSPDRGLDIMLELWPEVRKRVPGAVLCSTYSRWYDIVAEQYPQAAPLRDRIIGLLEQPGVTRIKGGLGQRALAELMRSSLVWAHPSWFTGAGAQFHETSCISAMEAQAAGCVVVASNWGALTETVQYGTLIDGDPTDPSGGWRERFVSAIVQGLTDPVTQAAAQECGPQAVRNMDWAGAADQLASLFAPARNGKPAHHPV